MDSGHPASPVDIEKLELVGSGGSAEVFALDETYVVKLFRPGYFDVAVPEFQRTSVVYALGASTPRPVSICSYSHRIGIIFERVHGPTLIRCCQESAASSWPELTGRLLAGEHFALHQIVCTNLPQFHDSARVHVDELPQEHGEGLRNLLGALPRGRSLLHLHLHPGNVLVGDKAVLIDWGDAHSGNRLVDVARSSLLIRFQGRAPAAAPNDPTREIDNRRRIADSYIDEYMKLSGITRGQIAVCERFFAAALAIGDDSTSLRSYRAGLDEWMEGSNA